MRGWQVVVAALLGAASVAAFAPLAWFPLLWLTLGGCYWLLNRVRTAGAGALLGGAFGLGFFGAGVSWVYVSLSVFGGMPMPAAAAATLAFCACLSFFPALAGALFVRFAPASWLARVLFFAALWALSEWLRGVLFTGFPWLSIAYSQTPPSPLAGFAPLAGVVGVGLLTALLAALLMELLSGLLPRGAAIRAGQRRVLSGFPLLPLLAVTLLLAGGASLRTINWTAPQGEPFSVALLQGNVAQDVKWRPETFAESLSAYHRLALDHPAKLTVLPETALPVFYERAPRDYLDELARLAARADGDLVFGIVTGDGERYANTALSLGVSPGQRYAKSHLVPFGEFTPPGFSWFMDALDIPMSDFTPGALKQAPLAIAGQQVAINICYEDLFGSEIIRALPQATLLVNLSNVAWFGDSLAPAQHLQIAQMRALETGRMMLRATNTGMTAIVGVDGRVQAVLPPFTRDALTGEVQGYSGTTPYVRWGDVPALLLAVLLLGLGALRRRSGHY
ncbi:apolipoprotein N-acyltransferase [Rhodocyclus tenuis]|uniref:apolipoprotein N-acyltransferase n=1 Tax=Rhodocyclus tenuis TaxID=1066 RepID=UPI0019073F58|nr:apolipoprotein N-acyltransferase [Rhodocyclus tenuis]MBK1681331.1 apolipoprotein N-acyltransferase [Rhodocyclus tenuis]